MLFYEFLRRPHYEYFLCFLSDHLKIFQIYCLSATVLMLSGVIFDLHYAVQFQQQFLFVSSRCQLVFSPQFELNLAVKAVGPLWLFFFLWSLTSKYRKVFFNFFGKYQITVFTVTQNKHTIYALCTILEEMKENAYSLPSMKLFPKIWLKNQDLYLKLFLLLLIKPSYIEISVIHFKVYESHLQVN